LYPPLCDNRQFLKTLSYRINRKEHPMSEAVTKSPNETNPRSPIARYLMSMIGVGVMIGILLFAAAGRLDWLWGWVYVALWMVTKVGWILYTMRDDADLAAERAASHANTKRWDQIIMTIYIVFALGTFVVGGLDGARFRWSDPLPLTVIIGAIAIHLLFSGMAAWVSLTNTFLSREARIQTDRGHAVITTGPYRYVRHPLYVTTLMLWLTTPLMLNALWALVPAVGACLAMVVRTALEDRMLHEELPGYTEYAAQTRYRLLPGVW
jgi:protein-S-isoprenylcysteine O-methyltransferase Ste14